MKLLIGTIERTMRMLLKQGYKNDWSKMIDFRNFMIAQEWIWIRRPIFFYVHVA